MSESSQFVPGRGPGLRILLAVLVVTLNLRGAITCVGPLLKTIQAEYDLSSTAAGLLTSLPLFAFGFISPYAAPLARRLGMERAIFVSLLLLLAGLGVRYLPGAGPLYFGTALIGTGIAISNVLLPGLLRRDFPAQLALVTALFSMVLVTVGGLGSGLSIPLADHGGWRFSLIAWALPVVVALVAWLPQLRRNSVPTQTSNPRDSLWRNGLAWQVSLFMGCQSSAFYVMIAWFPSMMTDLEGLSAGQAGWILFVYQIFVLGSVMAIPLMIHRLRDQRWIGAGCASLILAGYCGLYLAPGQAMAWMIVMGLGAGGSLVLSMTLFGLRSSTALQAVALSGMAQAVGYLMAAMTPIVVGYLRDATGDWQLPLVLLIVVCATQVLMGYLSGRPRLLSPAPSMTS